MKCEPKSTCLSIIYTDMKLDVILKKLNPTLYQGTKIFEQVQIQMQALMEQLQSFMLSCKVSYLPATNFDFNCLITKTDRDKISALLQLNPEDV